MTRPRQTITHLPADQLRAHPGNIRDDLGDLTDMAASIREHGILQPLTVTEDGDRFVILAGHRRFNAGLMLGLATFPVIIRHGLDDQAEQTIVMLVENCQRRDLSPVEKAEAFGSLRNQGLNLAEIARRTGVKASTVSTLIALLDLDERSREDVHAGHVNAGDAIAAVRQVRQQRRAAGGGRRVGRPLIVEPMHFSGEHPLLPLVSSICGHTTRPKVGQTMCCGQCWETVIRCDATGAPLPEPIIDEMVVERILDGDLVHATPCERTEVVRRWHASGQALNELARRTGWKIERYFRVDAHEVAS